MRKLRGKKLKKQKRLVILSLTILMIFFTTGYAAFSTKIRLNAKGNIKSYKLTLDPNGGILDITSKRVTKGKAYGELPTPTREGYIFKGWNGKNLLDEEKIIEDCYIKKGEGTQVDYNSTTAPWNCSDYIEIEGGKTYAFNPNSTAGNNNTSHSLYDINYNFIESFNSGLAIMNMPLNAKYVRISYRRSNSTNIQLEEGAEATEWEPYYITSDTIVTQEGAHTLTAIWEEEPVEQTEP